MPLEYCHCTQCTPAVSALIPRLRRTFSGGFRVVPMNVRSPCSRVDDSPESWSQVRPPPRRARAASHRRPLPPGAGAAPPSAGRSGAHDLPESRISAQRVEVASSLRAAPRATAARRAPRAGARRPRRSRRAAPPRRRGCSTSGSSRSRAPSSPRAPSPSPPRSRPLPKSGKTSAFDLPRPRRVRLAGLAADAQRSSCRPRPRPPSRFEAGSRTKTTVPGGASTSSPSTVKRRAARDARDRAPRARTAPRRARRRGRAGLVRRPRVDAERADAELAAERRPAVRAPYVCDLQASRSCVVVAMARVEEPRAPDWFAIFDQAAAASAGRCSSSARNVGDSSRLRFAPLVELELREDRARLGRPRALPRAPLAGEPVAQLVEAVGARRRPADDELRRDGAVPAVLLQPERDVVAPARRRRSSCLPMPNAIAEPASRPRWRTRNRRCLPSPTRREVGKLAAVDEQRHARVAETERREAAELRAQLEPELRAGHDRVDLRDRPQVVVGEHRVGSARRTPRRTSRCARARSSVPRPRGARRSA